MTDEILPQPWDTPEERCAKLRALDAEYDTSPDSPLHHDNRHCPIHGPGRYWTGTTWR